MKTWHWIALGVGALVVLHYVTQMSQPTNPLTVNPLIGADWTRVGTLGGGQVRLGVNFGTKL